MMVDKNKVRKIHPRDRVKLLIIKQNFELPSGDSMVSIPVNKLLNSFRI